MNLEPEPPRQLGNLEVCSAEREMTGCGPASASSASVALREFSSATMVFDAASRVASRVRRRRCCAAIIAFRVAPTGRLGVASASADPRLPENRELEKRELENLELFVFIWERWVKAFALLEREATLRKRARGEDGSGLVADEEADASCMRRSESSTDDGRGTTT